MELEHVAVRPLRQATPADSLKADFLSLKRQMENTGLYKADAGWYLRTSAIATALLATAVAGVSTGSIIGAAVALVCLALYYPQMAFLAHDFAHQQVFRGTQQRWNRYLGTYLFAALGQGLSYTWWKKKHDAHHSTPNTLDVKNGKIEILDTDVDTLPYLIWDLKLLPLEKHRALRAWISVQRFALFPLLTLARVSWTIQSFISVVQAKAWSELAVMTTHYAAALAIIHAVSGWGWLATAAFFTAAQLGGGLLLSWVFILSHSGLEICDKRDQQNFFELQVLTTRNLSTSPWMNWFTGGLNSQLEHHLFPTLPRHQLTKVAARTKTIVEKNGFKYESLGFWRATKVIYDSLPREI